MLAGASTVDFSGSGTGAGVLGFSLRRDFVEMFDASNMDGSSIIVLISSTRGFDLSGKEIFLDDLRLKIIIFTLALPCHYISLSSVPCYETLTLKQQLCSHYYWMSQLHCIGCSIMHDTIIVYQLILQ